MDRKFNIAFFGSSLVSAYWNGAATYYRGIIKTLHQHGHQITFYEPDAYARQENRDIPDPDYAKVLVYPPTAEEVNRCIQEAATADIIIKASGVGIFDKELEEAVLNLSREDNQVIFWDVDAPATLDRMIKDEGDYFRALVPRYDQIFTYGGGEPVAKVYKSFGARECTSIYNAFDTVTHHPVEPVEKFGVDLAFLGNRLPDREVRVEHFFIDVARALPDRKFLLGGSGWEDKDLPSNIIYYGHVPTKDHNAFNSSPLAVLNISRDSMASYGYSPATRVFEAAGARACMITDEWKGIDSFFEVGKEILVANSTEEVINILISLNKEKAKAIGFAAYEKALGQHTYSHRAQLLEDMLQLKKATV